MISKMTFDKILKLNSDLEPSPVQKAHEVDKEQATHGHRGDVNTFEIQGEIEAKEGRGTDEIGALFDEEFGRREVSENRRSRGGESHVAKPTGLLIDVWKAGGEEVDEGTKDGEVNHVMDTAEMCYDAVVLHMLPPEGSHGVQDSSLEYTEAYLASLADRDPVGISTGPVPSSPTTAFHQASNIDVAGSNAVVATWGDFQCIQESRCSTPASSSDNASPGGSSSIADKAFVESLCEEPLKVDAPDLAKDGLSTANGTPRCTRLEAMQSSEVSDPENEYFSVLSSKYTDNCEDRITVSGTLSLKEKEALGELSLRSVLSDPITGAFMDDAMVAMCGHSFGSGGLQRVLETHLCASCGACVSPATLVPNFALRAAVLAYKHEDPSWQLCSKKGPKRRRDQFESPEDFELKGISKAQQDTVVHAELTYADGSRPRGVQFPFAVSNRVLIKGNKRTPERFVGMEAIITSQCLNGWYMVRTLDTGESVRLQYRSLQKLGEMKASEAQHFVEQCHDVCGSPLGIESPAEFSSEVKSANDTGLQSGPLTSPQDTVIPISAYSSTVVPEAITAHCSERESNAALEHLIEPGENVNSLNLKGGFHDSSQQLLADQGVRQSKKGTVAEDLSNLLHSMDDYTGGNLEGAGQEECFNVVQMSVANEMGRNTSTLVESEDGDMHHPGLHEATVADTWIQTDMNNVKTLPLKSGQGPEEAVNTGTSGDIEGVTEFLVGGVYQQNGNEPLRTRSRRTALQIKTCTLPEDFICNTDPYRKVYSSGSRRRGGKQDSVPSVTTVGMSVDNKSVMKELNLIEKGSGLLSAEGSTIGVTGTHKEVKDLKLKTANDILQIMRKDMLKLEKQIPGNYLMHIWRNRRAHWRKLVKASHSVSDLGAHVRDFRYSLLLTAAGGMSDEEWEMRIALIIDSGDVELLVSLWGRLYIDVYKWLESRSMAVKGKVVLHSLFPAEDAHETPKDPELIGGAMSSVHMTTAATIATIDAVAEGQQDPDTSIKALIASTRKLLHQQSITELSVVREVLDREKRHVTAKLAHLEDTVSKLSWSMEPKAREDDAECQKTLTDSPEQLLSMPTDPFNHIPSSRTIAHASKQNSEADSDSALPSQDPDGEATDMSDSD